MLLVFRMIRFVSCLEQFQEHEPRISADGRQAFSADPMIGDPFYRGSWTDDFETRDSYVIRVGLVWGKIKN